MCSTYPSTIWDESSASYAHALAKNSVSVLYYTELYNCSQPAADLVKFDVNNSCTAALSYFDKGHCYWMPLIVETMFSLKRVRAGHALHLYQNNVPGVVPIMFRGLCQALCSVMRWGQLSGLTCVNETSRTFRGGMKKKEEIAICRPRPS